MGSRHRFADVEELNREEKIARLMTAVRAAFEPWGEEKKQRLAMLIKAAANGSDYRFSQATHLPLQQPALSCIVSRL